MTTGLTTFADPYKRCQQCGSWVDGMRGLYEPGTPALVPCGHRCDYTDLCPSWGPVDGCRCSSEADAAGCRHGRVRTERDGHVY